jgi:hypothetical protein
LVLQALSLHDNGRLVLREHKSKDHDEAEAAMTGRRPLADSRISHP